LHINVFLWIWLPAHFTGAQAYVCQLQLLLYAFTIFIHWQSWLWVPVSAALAFQEELLLVCEPYELPLKPFHWGEIEVNPALAWLVSYISGDSPLINPVLQSQSSEDPLSHTSKTTADQSVIKLHHCSERIKRDIKVGHMTHVVLEVFWSHKYCSLDILGALLLAKSNR